MCAKLSGLTLLLALCAWAACPATVQAADEDAAHAPDAAHADADHGSDHGGGDHGHGDHIGLADAGLDVQKPEEIRSDLAFFTFVVFLCLLAVLWKFAWGPIVAALERREAAVAEHIAQAERNHEQAKLLLAEYEQRLAGAANEVRELLEEARRDAEHTKQSILAEARQGAEAEKARALREIESAADAALETLAERSSQLAVDLAGKIVAAHLSKDDHARLIQEAVAKFPVTATSNN